MSKETRSKLVNLLELLVLVITIVQGSLAASPLKGNSLVITSAILMFLAIAFTAWKQYVSNLISNNSTKKTLLIAIVATLLGVVDLVQVFPLGETISQWVRFYITLMVAIMNAVSQYIDPLEESRGGVWHVKNNNNNLYLVDLDVVNNTPTWGYYESALSFTQTDATNKAAALGGGAIVPIKGF